jgi:hypothetical protein
MQIDGLLAEHRWQVILLVSRLLEFEKPWTTLSAVSIDIGVVDKPTKQFDSLDKADRWVKRRNPEALDYFSVMWRHPNDYPHSRRKIFVLMDRAYGDSVKVYGRTWTEAAGFIALLQEGIDVLTHSSATTHVSADSPDRDSEKISMFRAPKRARRALARWGAGVLGGAAALVLGSLILFWLHH